MNWRVFFLASLLLMVLIILGLMPYLQPKISASQNPPTLVWTPFPRDNAPNKSTNEFVQQIPANWKQYVDPYWHLKLRYPPDWIVTSIPYQGFGVRFSSPDLEIDEYGNVTKGGYFWIDVSPRTKVSDKDEVQTLDQGLEIISSVHDHTYQTRFLHVASPSVSLTTQELIIASLDITETPGQYPPLPFDQTELDALLKLPFPVGSAFISSGGGYNNGAAHSGVDKYALDFCMPAADNCQNNDYYVVAPTKMTYVHTDSNRDHFHFFEIAADTDSQFKLCMSLAHFYLQVPLSKGDIVHQGAVLGMLGGFNPPHRHMGIWVAPADDDDCVRLADGDYLSLPYIDQSFASPNGDFRLEGQSYPVCDEDGCENAHAWKPVESSNTPFCYEPPDYGSYNTSGSRENSDLNPADCFPPNQVYLPIISNLQNRELIAFIGDDKNVWVSDVEGQNRVQLTSDAVGDVEYDHLKWSPTGKDLAVARFADHDSRILSINVASGEIETLLSGVHGSFDWSPSGDSIVFSDVPYKKNDYGEEKGGLSLLNLSTNEINPIIPPADDWRAVNPDWSPVGNYLIFDIEPSPYPTHFWASEMAMADVRNGSYIQVESIISTNGCDWAPDGEHLACTNHNGEFLSNWLIILSAEASVVDYIQDLSATDFRMPRWSPDGSQIVYSKAGPYSNYGLDLWNLDIEDAHIVSDSPFLGSIWNLIYPKQIIAIQWSPDGEKLLAIGDPYGSPEIVVISFGTGEVLLISGGREAAWQPARSDALRSSRILKR